MSIVHRQPTNTLQLPVMTIKDHLSEIVVGLWWPYGFGVFIFGRFQFGCEEKLQPRFIYFPARLVSQELNLCHSLPLCCTLDWHWHNAGWKSMAKLKLTDSLNYLCAAFE